MKRLKNIFVTILITGFLITAALQVFSPYKKHDGLNYAHIKASIIIERPVAEVFAYLGNSERSSEWSHYVHHVNVLNETLFPDGRTGSTRRCFRNSNEKGIRWDEEIIAVEEGKRRRFRIFNTKNIPLESDSLMVEQVFHDAGNNRCRLSLTLFYHNYEQGFTNNFNTRFAAWKIKYIFDQNLRNIKKKLEAP